MEDAALSARIQQMRLRDLLLLEHIAAHGSLRRVADAMHLTQPAITQSLKSLEDAFGVSLVNRGRSGAQLTAAGEAVLVRVRAAGHELRAAQQAALQSALPVVRVGSSPAAMLTLVPRALVALRKKAPQTRVVLSELGVAALWGGLEQGSFDAVVTRLPNLSLGKRLPDGLAMKRIGQEKMVLACAPGHPAAQGKATPARLAGCEWALPPADALAVAMLNEWFAQSGARPPLPKVTCGSFYTSLQVVARSDLITIAPASAAQALQPTLKLRVIPWKQGHLDIVFACRQASLDNPAVRDLRGCFE